MMVADGLGTEASVRVAQTTFIVAHKQQRFDAEVFCTFFHLSQIPGIVGLVLEENVNVLDCVDAKSAGLFCKIEVVQFRLLPAEKPFVERPLSQRYLEIHKAVSLKDSILITSAEYQNHSPASRNPFSSFVLLHPFFDIPHYSR